MSRIPASIETTPRDRRREGAPPLIASACDTCGGQLPDQATKRGDPRRFCSPDCRSWFTRTARTIGPFLLQAALEERLYKHTDPARSNAARSAVAEHIAAMIADMDADRARHRAAGYDITLFGEGKRRAN